MFKKQIENGIAWMDAKYGRKNWLSRIDLGKLNMANSNKCMLGQLEGNYHNFVITGLSPITGGSPKKTFAWAVAHGFAARSKYEVIGELKYFALDKAWHAKIKQLKAEEEANPTPEPTPEPEIVTPPEEVTESPLGTPSPIQRENLEGKRVTIEELKNKNKKK